MAHVFISYAREDGEAAARLREDLVAAGFDVWLDVVDLLPGQQWSFEIDRALRDSSHVIVLISAHSVSKRGFVQKEVRDALAILDEVPPDTIFLIPVRLDDSRPLHPRLEQLQWIDLHRDYSSAVRQLVQSLSRDLTKLRSAAFARHSQLAAIEDIGKSAVPSVLTNLPLTAKIRARLGEPLEMLERFRSVVERLVERGRWSYSIGVAYPRELLSAEDDLEADLRRFVTDARAAAREIENQYKGSPVLFRIVRLLGRNPFTGVQSALYAAAVAAEDLAGMCKDVKRGLTLDQLRSDSRYQKAAAALNAVEDGIRTQQRDDDSAAYRHVYSGSGGEE